MANEERATLVRQYCTKNPSPVQELCPEFNQYFRKGKGGFQAWNSRTGERNDLDINPTYWRDRNGSHLKNLVCVRPEYEALYIHYIDELDALELARVWMEGNRGKDGVTKDWDYSPLSGYYRTKERYFIFHDDPDAYSYNGVIVQGNKYYAKEVLSAMKDWSSRSMVSKENYDEFIKFSPNRNLCETKYYYATDIPQIWQYARWYQMDFIERKKSQTVQNVSAYDLEEKQIDKPENCEHSILFEKLDDKYAVLRVFKYPSSWEVIHGGKDANKSTECARLFVSDKGKPSLMVPEYGEWKIKASTPWDTKGRALIVNPEEMQEWKPLKYIIPCLDIENVSIQSFIDILRHPIVEQLSKAGYPTLARQLTDCSTIPSNLKEYYLVEKERKLPMFKLLGVNKFVLNAAEKYNSSRVVREIKFFLGGFDATEAPQDVCEYIGQYVGGENGGFYNYHSITELIPGRNCYWRRAKYDRPVTDEERKWIMKIFRMEAKHAGCITLYKDVISTYNNIREKPEIDLYNVKSFDDINRLHDALVALQIREEQERRAMYMASERERMEMLQKKFDKLQDDRIEKYEYEDDNFCIRVPHELKEITKEGIVLHHCVGGYVDKHAQGWTNIIFLRRKGAEEIPFYTIEINNNHVVQIHGSHNKWLGNDPDAVPFMYKYLNQLGVDYDTKLLLNKGAGYSAGSESLDESYLQAA